MYSYFKLTVWAVVWLIIWFVVLPLRRGRENCLTYAVQRWDKEGGYLVIRWCRSNKSRWLVWPHFLWIDSKYHRFMEHAVPVEKEHDEKLVPAPWFAPKIKHGDKRGEVDEN